MTKFVTKQKIFFMFYVLIQNKHINILHNLEYDTYDV